MAARRVSQSEVQAGAERLGLAGLPVCLHASLRSFPALEDGPATLVDGLLACGATVMVATMANESFGVPAPADDRPGRNGIDYAAEDRRTGEVSRPGQRDRYDPSRTEVDRVLGATPAYVAARPDRVRCRLPTGTFSAVGPLAASLIQAEVAADTFGPLRELVLRSGWVLLAGVGLNRMTLLHLAEVEAGRRAFVRWALGPDGRPTRSVGGGCSEGFEHLAVPLASVEFRVRVGESLWRAYPAAETVALAAGAIVEDPSITRCGDPGCLECRDAIAGGPIERPSPRAAG